MIVTNLTSPSVIGGSVWQNSTRTLTGFGSAIGLSFGTVHSILPNGSTSNYPPNTGQWMSLIIGNEATPNASFSYQLNNGSISAIIQTITAGATGLISGPSSSSVFFSITNTGTAAGFLSVSGIAWNQ